MFCCQGHQPIVGKPLVGPALMGRSLAFAPSIPPPLQRLEQSGSSLNIQQFGYLTRRRVRYYGKLVRRVHDLSRALRRTKSLRTLASALLEQSMGSSLNIQQFGYLTRRRVRYYGKLARRVHDLSCALRRTKSLRTLASVLQLLNVET